MELHELKNTWTVLDEQLKKNEMLNNQIIHEMLQKKSNKSLNRLINTDFVGLLVVLFAIPTAIFSYHLPRFENFLFPKILFVSIVPIALFGLIFYSYKLKYLIKINFSKSIKDNMYCLNKYIIILKRDKMFTAIVTLILAILGALCYYELKAGFPYWIFLIVAVTIGVLVSYWIFKRVYDTNIHSIKQSLEELRDLKEE